MAITFAYLAGIMVLYYLVAIFLVKVSDKYFPETKEEENTKKTKQNYFRNK